MGLLGGALGSRWGAWAVIGGPRVPGGFMRRPWGSLGVALVGAFFCNKWGTILKKSSPESAILDMLQLFHTFLHFSRHFYLIPWSTFFS